MARLKVKAQVTDDYDGPVPSELRARVTVREWAPEVFESHGGIEPSQSDAAWFNALMLARSRHRDAWHRWVADMGLTPDEARMHWAGRRPVWS